MKAENASPAAFALVWFRNDLRCYDNAALLAAQATGLPVVALYIATPTTWQQHSMAPMKQDLLRRRAQQLQQELAAFDIPLWLVEGSDYRSCEQIIATMVQQGAVAVFAQREYELREQQRDQAVAKLLTATDVSWQLVDTQCRFAPGSIVTKSGDIYKVFTPFKKVWLGQLQQQGVQCLPKPQPQPPVWQRCPASLTPMHAGDGSSSAYVVEEQQVLAKLRHFCRELVQDYQVQRDFPAIAGTSGLSAYLAIGVISPQQAIARLMAEAESTVWQEKSGAAVWLSELIWREFYKHILVAYPDLIKHQPFQQDTNAIVWGNNPKWFQAWCEGLTGYPIVDAAMRQLNQTGWMHNRLRMIVASFLVKDLQIDWRLGERYFMSKLIDGDFAANNGGWQWAASTGTDAAPYFRIFNPVTQSERFDPKGNFIRAMLPELAQIPLKHIHWPHPLPMSVRYPTPIVDHAKARLKTLAMFKAAKQHSDTGDISSDT